MDVLEDIVLKHDGIIWGSYVWSIMNGTPTNKMRVRFIDKNIFSFGSVFELSNQFMIDINERFVIKTFAENTIILDNGTEIEIRVHNPIKELDFASSSDYTCNLMDYNRSGMFLRNIPMCISFNSSPYKIVKAHIMNKELVPVDDIKAIEKFGEYSDDWTFKQTNTSINISKSGNGEDICSICHSHMIDDTCVTLKCSHVFHLSCIAKWVERKTCPMCRDQI